MGNESKTSNLESGQKALLLRSVAQYLERCGFSKCVKKLLSEAEIEKKELNTTLPDLEEVYGEFLKKRDHEDAANGITEVNAMEGVEDVKKEKKKKKKETKVEVAEEEMVKETDTEIEDGLKEKKKKETKVEVAEEEMVKETDTEIVDGLKEKKKKKKKETKVEAAEEEKVKETDTEIVDGLKEKKKKKKKKETKVEAAEEEKVKETDTEIEDGLKEENKKKSKFVEADDDEEKVSKKRKRSEPEETKEETEDDDEESKRRKKEEKVVEGDEGVQETPVKQTDIEENGNVEKSETKSTNQKSGKGLSNSKEPKKPFQRVNVEEVVFTDNRLKDNSYWAKGGADVGYGAKAQEVLGQVRGRGFRHEKTKKKRGSYRGGEIDLQSHSVKFDYSDEE